MRWPALGVLLASCTAPDAADPVADPPPDAPVVPDLPAEDLSAQPVQAYDPLALVDPFIATGGIGAEIANLNPGPLLPLGMVHLGPDTAGISGLAPPFYHCAGYYHPDTFITAFSHTHAHGMGVPDYGTIGFLPRDGWDPAYTRDNGRLAAFSHDQEEARPGYYAVTLTDDGTRVELAATLRGGHTRMTFADGAEPVVVLDLGHLVPSSTVAEAFVDWAPGDPVVTGFQRAKGSYSGRFGGLMTSFHATLDPAPTGGGGWDDPDSPVPGATHAEGPESGAWFTFPPGTTTVELRLAISYTDAAGAAANHAAELEGVAFEAHGTAAEEAWRALLGRVRVAGGTDEQRVVFHTALYNALKFPSRMDDVDGRYRGHDQAIKQGVGPYVSDLSLWDTFRTTHPWYALAWPEVQTIALQSMVRMIVDGGALPKWPLAHGYTGGMVGSPAIQVLSESWQKGLRDFDVQTAYDAAWATATGPVPAAGRGGLDDYLTRGWVAVEDGGGSVSDTLEYAWNDHALALWAEGLGRPEDERVQLWKQASSWRNLYNADAGYFTGRYRDGTWAWEDAPLVWDSAYVEGNAYHYLWYVPYDPMAMVDVQHGGDLDAFLTRWTAYWDDVYAEEDDVAPDDYYWHGNEPVMHVAFLVSLVGRPDLTADPARWVLSHRYGTGVDGLDGNDDAGTLSAWALFASIGLFPVAGTPTYALASPVFERVEIDRGDGSQLVLRAPGASETRRYPVAWAVGETPLGPTVDHDTLLSGGDVLIELADAPVPWGAP